MLVRSERLWTFGCVLLQAGTGNHDLHGSIILQGNIFQVLSDAGCFMGNAFRASPLRAKFVVHACGRPAVAAGMS
ncbi:hypothetical protein AURDEDRAFT_178599 [Auricularia subglabra TFB-10046 SS5]|uniref:Uncharacterized protein n=1 Tax=Auricularia subglabra (strain TFB-10046 / SS5) TaxID=717982 RepID=J0L7N4_AURST|nr:hypothetical protein AURDEDRAFT_178599 [Auricularia subglabra TFB-10046 SS5]